MAKYTKEQVKYVFSLREEGLTFLEITEKFSEIYFKSSSNSIRNLFYRYRDVDIDTHFSLDHHIRVQTQKLRLQDNLNKSNRLSKMLLREAITANAIDDYVSTSFERLSGENRKKLKSKYTASRISISNTRAKSASIEQIISDVHIGLKTETFNLESVEKMMGNILASLMQSVIDLKGKKIKCEEIVVAFLGDSIHSSDMHYGQDTTTEMYDSEQLYHAFRIFYVFLKDLYFFCNEHKVNLTVTSVAGNHDRIKKNKSISQVGRKYFNYTIFKSIEHIFQENKFKNVNFIISETYFAVYEMQGIVTLYEHGDFMSLSGSNKIVAYQNYVNSRRISEKIMFDIHRFVHGHHHTPISLLANRYISNGGFPTDDQYAKAFLFERDVNPSQSLCILYDDGYSTQEFIG